jgi:hypothetical protein
MNLKVDPEIMSGTPVFRGTRVPVRSLFEYLECLPTVKREGAIAVLERSQQELLVRS